MSDPVRQSQVAFVKGEVGSSLEGRADLEWYGNALRTAYNVILHRHGGASGRPGTKFIGEVKDSSDLARLLPFQFSTVQEYQLILGDAHSRFIKDDQFVLEAAQDILSISQASPGSLEVTGHSYSVNDQVYVASVGGMTALNARYFRVNTVPDSDHITLKDMWGVAINTSAFPAFTSGGTVSRVYERTLPYSDTEAQAVDYEQTADTMFLTHMGYAVRKLTRSDHAVWSISSAAFATAQAPPTSCNATAVVSDGYTFTPATTYKYVVTAVNELTDEESVQSNGDTCVNDLSSSGNTNTITWVAAASATYYNIYRDQGGSGFYGFIGSATALTFTDDNLEADFSQTPPKARDPIGSSGNYPGRVTMHENRMVFGQTTNEPSGLFLSKIGRFENLNWSIPPRGTDALQYVFTPGVHAIEALCSVKDVLACFTAKGEVTLSPGGGSDAITPVSVRRREHSEYGAKAIKPLKVGDVALFADSFGQIVRAFGYSFQQDGFLSNDLTLLAPHIFESYTLTGWAYQQAPHSMAWVVRADGLLASCTLQLDQNVFAWARHALGGTFGSGDSATGYGVVLSVCHGRGATQNKVVFLVKRTINSQTKIYAEVLMPYAWGTDVADYWGLDCALLYEGAATSFVTGLHHLEGQTVAALVNGSLVEGLTVTAGRIDLPDGVTGTKILVGLQAPHPRMVPLPVRGETRQGSGAGRKKKIAALVMRLKQSLGLKAGYSEDTLCPLKLPRVHGTTEMTPYSGVFNQSLQPKFDDDGVFIIEGTSGLPFTILTFHPDIVTGG